MIVGMTKLISQMHFLSHLASVPLFIWTRCLRHLWTGGTCEVHVSTRIKQFVMQWQIWKILLTICKTNWNVIFSRNIYSNPLNAFSVWCFSANSSPSGWNCITVLFWELYWTPTHTSWTPGIVWTILQTSKVSGLQRAREGLYILWVKTLRRWLTKACVNNSADPGFHLLTLPTSCLSLWTCSCHCPSVSGSHMFFLCSPPLIWLVKLTCLCSGVFVFF